MDSRPTTAESKHHYQASPWPRAPSGSATPRANPVSTPDSSPAYFPSHLDLLPILFPQQSFYDRLLQYNKLVSAGRGGGGGLQTPPLPALSPHAQSTNRSRSSSKVSTKDSPHSKPGAQSCHGNRAAKTSNIADRVLIAPGKESAAKMSGKKHSEQVTNHTLPARPPPPSSQSNHLPAAQQSSSVPSTPHQHARKFSFGSREPSPGATQNHSPRSAYSETNVNVPSLRPLPPRNGGCRFETAVTHPPRRIPYSIGTDRLEKIDLEKIKSRLSEDDERKLSTDMRELYDRLLPTKEVEINRKKLVQKLEKLFNDEWPGNAIQVHLFGSSGNLLCSDDSDVDICITTTWRGMENVCLIADFLDRHGMKKVVCVKSAKVPIVKMWDPELNLACDMNVNNTLALENTRMVRTYVGIDDRVRQLAMVIKYWTRRRILNEAAFGGTLSSYTWICLIIAFLQVREPPILPALHQLHDKKLLRKDGTRSEFADDLDKLRGLGAKNKDSIAALLFQFFRFYAHEFDYDKHALSIRFGKLLTKVEKKWHLGNNNMLCIEEPFNTMRNLGNTADDTSFRGLHMELRRAFDLISEGKFEECCEQYVYPKEEERVWHKPTVGPRPILVRSSSQQQSARGGRGGRYRGNQHIHRNGNSSRRASSSVAYDTNGAFAQPAMAPPMTPQHYLWYQQANSQMGISQDLLSSSLLAAQENMQFHLFTHAQQLNQHAAIVRMQGGPAQTPDRSRTNSFDNPPLSAPLRPEMLYNFPIPLQGQPYYHTGFTTFPSSPSPATASEFRRSLHRGTVASDSGASTGSGALRSQSQPASRSPMPTAPSLAGYPTTQAHHGMSTLPSRHINGASIPSFTPDELTDKDFDDAPTKPLSESPQENDGGRVMGCYMSDNQSPARKVTNGFPSAVPTFGDLSHGAQGRRRLSTDQLPQSILDRRMKRTSRSPSPLGHARAFSVGTNSAPLASATFHANGKLTPNRAPMVVNGSKPVPTPISTRLTTATEHISSDDANFDNPLHINQGQAFTGSWADQPTFHPASSAAVEPSPPMFSSQPCIVNGSSSGRSPITSQAMADASFQQRVAAGTALQNGIPYASVIGDMNGIPGFSPPSTGRSQTILRQQPNGLAPLDLATGDFAAVQDLQHLSPVYENRTPSPTAVRRFDAPAVVQYSKALSAVSGKDSRSDLSKLTQKTPPTGPSVKHDSVNRSPILDSRLGGSTGVNGITRESGHVRAAKSQSENWERPKTRKKGVADLKKAASGSEQMPKNDSERKGG
ncbi:hypothetical protein B0H67DRAFT_548289 [Lasiosphaeris hirsuta]|uniref:polynucleotide adenylyltransferase n=1 Tax=Lasiosphaeris hirsuta TaxID=260670 RepID=A0AA40BA04_9PEZI|nr:hypothetical protein B0H67DRAFT_548289 [Lasiosphaeris hirsuta]